MTIPSLFERAAATDALYFEMGAQVEQLPGAALAWMPGLTGLAAGAVVQRVDGATVARMGSGWVSEIEEALVRVGARLARIYLDDGSPADSLLRRAGYVMRPELVFAHAFDGAPGDVVLLRVERDEDWER